MLRLMLVTVVASYTIDDDLLSECQVRVCRCATCFFFRCVVRVISSDVFSLDAMFGVASTIWVTRGAKYTEQSLYGGLHKRAHMSGRL